MRHVTFVLVLAGSLAACGTAAVRYPIPAVEPGDRIRIAARSVEIAEVSLPSFARTEEIWTETPAGGLVSDPAVLWADEPTRGVTQELTRYLATITGALVAAAPWPFDEPAAARLSVRLDEMVAGADGQFRIAGQYLSTRREGGRDRATAFRIVAPITPDSGVPGIAAARATVMRELARQIAEAGL
jgi:hypothetical protein